MLLFLMLLLTTKLHMTKEGHTLFEWWPCGCPWQEFAHITLTTVPLKSINYNFSKLSSQIREGVLGGRKWRKFIQKRIYIAILRYLSDFLFSSLSSTHFHSILLLLAYCCPFSPMSSIAFLRFWTYLCQFYIDFRIL